MTTQDQAWICVEEKTFLDFPYIQVIERQCKKQGQEGEPHRFYVFQSKDWCNVIPITEEGKVVIVRQFRAGTMKAAYEFPGGVMESTDSDIQATALREMTEETGYEPLPGARCELLGTSHPNPALQDNRVHSLIVGPVKKTRPQSLDPSEDIEVLEVSPDELLKMLLSGEFSHALMLTSLHHFLMREPYATRALTEGLRGFSATGTPERA